MRLTSLEAGKYTIFAEIIKDKDGNDIVGVLDELKRFEKMYEKHIKGFAALFTRFSISGKAGQPAKVFHLADSGDKIYEFIKGPLRLLCFFTDAGDAVILSHCEIKKGQKLSSKALNRARKLKNQYHLDFKAGNISIEAQP